MAGKLPRSCVLAVQNKASFRGYTTLIYSSPTVDQIYVPVLYQTAAKEHWNLIGMRKKLMLHHRRNFWEIDHMIEHVIGKLLVSYQA